MGARHARNRGPEGVERLAVPALGEVGYALHQRGRHWSPRTKEGPGLQSPDPPATCHAMLNYSLCLLPVNGMDSRAGGEIRTLTSVAAQQRDRLPRLRFRHTGTLGDWPL